MAAAPSVSKTAPKRPPTPARNPKRAAPAAKPQKPQKTQAPAGPAAKAPAAANPKEKPSESGRTLFGRIMDWWHGGSHPEPSKTAQPGKADQPGKAAQPGKADQPARADQPAKAAQPELKLDKGQTLRKGDESPQVKQLQEILNRSGAKLDPDGKFGNHTRKALEKFQREHKMEKVDGVVGPNTLAELNKVNGPPQTTPAKESEPVKAVDKAGPKGDLGSAVRDGRAGDKTNLGRLRTLADARRTDKGLYFRAGAAIDTDGSGPSHGDRYHQSKTSLKTRDKGYVNADKTPYFVLPPQVARKIGAHPGDLGLIKRGDKTIPAVFADVGPRNKIGEISYNAAQQLGINPHPNKGGTERPEVEYMVFPGSGTRRPSAAELTPEALDARVRQLLAR